MQKYVFWQQEESQKEYQKKCFSLLSAARGAQQKTGRSQETHCGIAGRSARIELFARQRSPGWDAWGNEVDSSLDMDYRREQDERIAGIFEKQAQCGRLFTAEELLNDLIAETEEKGFAAGAKYTAGLGKELFAE